MKSQLHVHQKVYATFKISNANGNTSSFFMTKEEMYWEITINIFGELIPKTIMSIYHNQMNNNPLKIDKYLDEPSCYSI